jgi:hypothetical protein
MKKLSAWEILKTVREATAMYKGPVVPSLLGASPGFLTSPIALIPLHRGVVAPVLKNIQVVRIGT